ncbi:MAG: DUF935 family protein [Caulobacter sp.]|nr:DUF935 family protein [Caulobacter sp.]
MPTPLVDWLGRPIDFTRLTEEVATPTVAAARSIIAGHPAQGLTPGRLAGILRSAEAGDPRAYFELAEEMEEKDLHYVGVLGTRKRQVSQLEMTVEAASDDAEGQADADLVREWLDRDTLEDDLFDILDAVGKGFSVTEIIWTQTATRWWPDRLEFVDPRWVRFDELAGREPMLIGDDGQLQALDPAKFVFHRIRAKSGLVIRGGLARPVSWAWMFKNYSVKDWVAFCEVYGLPLRLGKYDGGATPEEKRALLRAVADIGTDAAAIIPKSMDITFENGASGADGSLFKTAADWFDQQVSKAVLGQTATTDAIAGGHAVGKEHNDVRSDIERADAKALGATLSRDIGRYIVDFNRGPPRSGKYPKIRIGRADAWDAEKMMPAVREFVSMGGKVGVSVIRDRLGLPDPAKDEELLTAPKAAEPAADKTPPLPANDPGARQSPAQPGRRASQASQGLLGPLLDRRRALQLAASAAEGQDPDPIDLLIGDVVGDGEWVTSPLADDLDAFLAEAGGIEQARARLAEAMASMDVTELTERLARASFSARLAGVAGDLLTELEDQL